MLNTFDWQQAVHDPRFWAVRYGGFPGVTEEAYNAYIAEYDFFNLAILEEDPLAGYVGEGDDPQLADVEVGYRRLSLPFPEGYIWQMDFAAEDGEFMTGIYHAIFHPDMDQTGILASLSGQGDTTGLSLAEESGHPRLPGLRWAELKQIATCLTQNRRGDFDVRAIIPLLYPVVELITFDDLQDVRQALAAAWRDLQVLDAAQIGPWLDENITVYEKGWELRFEKEWKPRYRTPSYEDTLWVQTGKEGWKTTRSTSMRHIKRDSQQFLPFFSMLERYS